MPKRYQWPKATKLCCITNPSIANLCIDCARVLMELPRLTEKTRPEWDKLYGRFGKQPVQDI